ncbi:hypothetical protein B0H14DRAFT_3425699 [Mycena olivaceomarginata]|nr:hypothetical protein B0H14DRAFT_3425699 [Mycena olivaceomarginata]
MNLWEGRVGPGPLPALETLVIRGLYMGRRCRFPSHQILELLRLAPNLVECVFSDVEVEFAPVARRTGGRLVLPNLRRLVFDESEVKRGTPFSRGVLDHLALPALEALGVNVGGAELLSFLMESSPPLRELVVTDPGNFSLLVRCLRLVPRLHQLELWGSQSDLAKHLFDELAAAAAKSPSLLLPQLSTLVFHFDTDENLSTAPESFWSAALHALRARRARLRVVNFEVAERIPPPPMPVPKIIIDGLRELVADEMKTNSGPNVNLCTINDHFPERSEDLRLRNLDVQDTEFDAARQHRTKQRPPGM